MDQSEIVELGHHPDHRFAWGAGAVVVGRAGGFGAVTLLAPAQIGVILATSVSIGALLGFGLLVDFGVTWRRVAAGALSRWVLPPS